MSAKRNQRVQREDVLTYSPILKYMMFFLLQLCL